MPGHPGPSDETSGHVQGYVGRFAPSPTGQLHLGTLTAAVASFLHARQAGGEWLVRIEDIDPPREVPGAADAILRALERLSLPWDRSVLYQSTRHSAYQAAAMRLLESGEAFRCRCSRQQIQALTGSSHYPGTCRNRAVRSDDSSVRLRVQPGVVSIADGLCGAVERDIAANEGDFVIMRRDGLPAYHLAVVMDDAFQGVTDIVRGRDLLDSTPLHVHLQDRLGLPTPAYWHIPVVTTAGGEKLSKGTGAPPIDSYAASEAATLSLQLLGSNPPAELVGAPPGLIWQWAVEHWRIRALAGCSSSLAPAG